jgi:hypothetical protein
MERYKPNCPLGMEKKIDYSLFIAKKSMFIAYTPTAHTC